MNEQEIYDKINELEQRVSEQDQIINKLVGLLENISNVMSDTKKLSEENKIAIENLPYEIMSPKFRETVYYPNILSKRDTLDKVKKGCSVSRFGDGELSLIFGKARWKFQPFYKELQARLLEILNVSSDSFIPCISSVFFGPVFSLPLDKDRLAIRCFIEDSDLHNRSRVILSEHIIYGDAVCFNIDCESDKSEIDRILKGRKITIIEGEKTRFGVGNDLLSCADSVRRIICPSIDAWQKYDSILDATTQESNDSIIIICLGPTASVLAYDLSKAGYQALDMGHADIVYDRYLGDPNYNLAFKDYINGGEGIDQVQKCTDEKYLSEIVKVI